MPDPSVRLHVVTGKGGTGKTTVAGALALALAASPGPGGRPARVLLMEVEGRQGLAGLFDVPPIGYEPVVVADAHGGGKVWALSVDAEEALLEYLELFYRIRRGGMSARALRRVGAIDFATSIAPGMADVLLTGKLKESVDRRDDRGGPAWDAVVCDAPPTGRIAQFLNVNAEVAGLARMGPVKGQADSVMRVLRSPQTRVHLVTLLESLPAQETADAVAELDEADLPGGMLVVNMVRPPLLPVAAMPRAERGALDRDAVVAGLRTAGLDDAEAVVDPLLAEAADHASRVALEESLRDQLADLDRPTYELPVLPDGVDVGGLAELAASLREQGVA